MRVAIVNPVWTAAAPTPELTLDRFPTLTGWAAAVRDAGGDVHVFQRFHTDAELRVDGIRYAFVKDRLAERPSLLYAGRTLSNRVSSVAPDIVHVNGLDHPRLTRRLRRVLPRSCGIVVQDHGGIVPASLSSPRKRLVRAGLRAANALLVATEPQVDEFRQSGAVPDDLPIRDVMEGSTTFSAQARAADRRALSVLFVGRLNGNKDPLTVLGGFVQFAATRTDATLSFVYDGGDLEPALRTAIAALDADLGSRIVLLGRIPHEQMASIYGQADLFVLGSHHEGSGYAAVEALACGLVPALTDIAPFRALTDHGRVGALWRVADPASLRAALEHLTALPLAAASAASRERFEQEFSWPAIGRRAMTIYQEVSRG
ncbi:MAG TPA: glycosyltransferase family 4 protein [Vicinamibacterales bacterium]|jgi:glycosyltransferase involved in cell wall biosynthesis